MAKYVDGFVIPIKKKNVKMYNKILPIARKVWMEHGAEEYYECVGDDWVSYGLTFPKLCKLKKDETAIFSFIVYKSKKARDAANKKIMKDPRIQMEGLMEKIIDSKRFAMAGFKTLITSKGR